MSWKGHDLVVAVLLVVLFALLSLPVQFGFSYWGDAPAVWVVYAAVGVALAVYVLYTFLRSARRLFAGGGDEREEARGRRGAIAVFGVMVIVWIVLGGISFVRDRARPDPAAVRFEGVSAVRGKQVFQAYNCMGCHTIVGNGAYLGPDLTKVSRDAGPAWLATFLASAGAWPPQAAVDITVDRLRASGELPVASADEYYARYAGARRRVTQRGGDPSLMPNLRFTAEEVSGLVAFLDYASRLDTAGWPPAPRADGRVVERMRAELGAARGAPPAPVAAAPPGPAAPAAAHDAHEGEEVSKRMGCVACHSTDGSPRVGPTWKGLADASVRLDDGRVVTADDGYLRESILDPNAKVVQGFPRGVMPSYAGRLASADVDAAITYIKSLR